MSGMMPEFPSHYDSSPPKKRGRIIVAIALVVLAGAAAGWFGMKTPTDATAKNSPAGESDATPVPVAVTLDSSARAPAGTRIRVRVLNTTSSRGLARRATFVLRDLGYDVVDFDSESGNRATTLILAHTARSDWAVRLQKAVGAAGVESRPAASRYVDFTVLLGRDWQRTPEAFRP